MGSLRWASAMILSLLAGIAVLALVLVTALGAGGCLDLGEECAGERSKGERFVVLGIVSAGAATGLTFWISYRLLRRRVETPLAAEQRDDSMSPSMKRL